MTKDGMKSTGGRNCACGWGGRTTPGTNQNPSRAVSRVGRKNLVREILGEGGLMHGCDGGKGRVTLNAVCWGGALRGRLDSLHAEMVSTHACILGSMRVHGVPKGVTSRGMKELEILRVMSWGKERKATR